ncbi:MAG: hypothetical protein J2P48_07180 [Alphaproteobacteria bacterium]|nr:hypothetical protein [Alphaproteobacteria bacterium]
MDLHLTDDQVELLVKELDRIIKGVRYPFLPRVQALRAIRTMLKPYPERRRAPPRYAEPPSRGRYRRRG